jgi:hypothetical protein
MDIWPSLRSRKQICKLGKKYFEDFAAEVGYKHVLWGYLRRKTKMISCALINPTILPMRSGIPASHAGHTLHRQS